MKKKKWFKQMKKHLSGLNKREQKRVFDYYEELYADKYETGLSEKRIIEEFGNPAAAARKISRENYSENSSFSADKKNRNKNNSDVAYGPSNYSNGTYGPSDYSDGAYVPPQYGGYGPQNYAYPNRTAGRRDVQTHDGNCPYIENNGNPSNTVVSKNDKYKKLRFFRLFWVALIALPYFAISIALFFTVWATMLALFVAGMTLMFGGVFSIASTIYAAIVGVPWLPYLGIVLGASGAGLLLIAAMIASIKSAAKRNGHFCDRMKTTFASLKNFCYC